VLSEFVGVEGDGIIESLRASETETLS